MACAAGETCLSGVCTAGGTCSGGTAATWEAIPGAVGDRGLQAWVPSGEPYMYVGNGGSFLRLEIATNAWTTLASPPGSGLAGWGSPALSGTKIYELREANLLEYDPLTAVWSTLRSDLHGGSDQHAQTVTDRDGALWSFNALRELVRYDFATGTASYFPVGVGTDMFETRVTYDELTHSIYFGGFNAPNLYRF